jgi:hypothetical protein
MLRLRGRRPSTTTVMRDAQRSSFGRDSRFGESWRILRRVPRGSTSKSRFLSSNRGGKASNNCHLPMFVNWEMEGGSPVLTRCISMSIRSPSTGFGPTVTGTSVLSLPFHLSFLYRQFPRPSISKFLGASSTGVGFLSLLHVKSGGII